MIFLYFYYFLLLNYFVIFISYSIELLFKFEIKKKNSFLQKRFQIKNKTEKKFYFLIHFLIKIKKIRKTQI